jgi:glycosyltransferase involved in cell wall biosynthesis
MKISLVVPAFNEERLLPATLANLKEVVPPPFELIVCDNNSTDRTAEIARTAGAKVVFEPVNQISRARNTGAAHASGDWLLFVDADSHPSRDLCDDVVTAISSGRYLAGGSTVCFEQQPDAVVAFIGSIWNAISRAMRWAAGSFIFCNAAVFREIGGFSQELYAAEEIDFSRRMKRAARQRGQAIAILRRHPLVTSARKAKLYTPREMLGFVARTIIWRGRTLRSAEECFSWYDGRR